MTKKEKLMNYIMLYNGYAVSTDVHVAPTRGISSGAHGRLYEMLIKLALQNYQFKGVAPARINDTRKRINDEWVDFEIKQGAGELVYYDNDGQVYKSVLDNKYIIYSVSYVPIVTDDCNEAVINAVKQSYIFDAQVFYELLKKNKFLRKKKSTAFYSPCNFSDKDFDRETIQTTKSTKREQEYIDLIKANGTPLLQWLQDNGIW